MDQQQSIWTPSINQLALKAADWALCANGRPRGPAFHREDVAQETLVLFWEACERDEVPERIEPLMCTIANRLVIREIRKDRVRRKAIPTLVLRSGEWVRFNQPAHDDDDTKPSGRPLLRALPKHLDETQFQVIACRLAYPHLTRAEIGRVLGISLARYKRALQEVSAVARGIPEAWADRRSSFSLLDAVWNQMKLTTRRSPGLFFAPEAAERIVERIPRMAHGSFWSRVVSEFADNWPLLAEVDRDGARRGLRHALRRMEEKGFDLIHASKFWEAVSRIEECTPRVIQRVVDGVMHRVERSYRSIAERELDLERKIDFIRQFGLKDVFEMQRDRDPWVTLRWPVHQLACHLPDTVRATDPCSPVIQAELQRLFVGFGFEDGIAAFVEPVIDYLQSRY